MRSSNFQFGYSRDRKESKFAVYTRVSVNTNAVAKAGTPDPLTAVTFCVP